jgi:hypothetical protein
MGADALDLGHQPAHKSFILLDLLLLISRAFLSSLMSYVHMLIELASNS